MMRSKRVSLSANSSARSASPCQTSNMVPIGEGNRSTNSFIHSSCPKMHHGVSPPGPPGFSRRQDTFWIFFSESSHDAQIRVWKRIRPPQCTHRDILRGPLADATDGLQFFDRRSRIVSGCQNDVSFRYLLRQVEDGQCARRQNS